MEPVLPASRRRAAGRRLALVTAAALLAAPLTRPLTAEPSCGADTFDPATPPTAITASTADQLDTLVRCVQLDLDAGRWSVAGRRLDQARRAYDAQVLDARPPDLPALLARLAATRAIDGGAWPALARVPVGDDALLPWLGPLVRGVASARAAWGTQDAALLDQAREALRSLEGLALAIGPVSEPERARLIVQGAIAGAQYEREDMQLLLSAADELERRLDPGDGRWLPVVIAQELEADLLRLTDRYAAASDRYRAVIARRPHRVQSWIGLADAYRKLGDVAQASLAANQARALWKDADPDARNQLP